MKDLAANDVSIGKIETDVSHIKTDLQEIKMEIREQRQLYATKSEVAQLREAQKDFIKEEEFDLYRKLAVGVLVGASLAVINSIFSLFKLR